MVQQMIINSLFEKTYTRVIDERYQPDKITQQKVWKAVCSTFARLADYFFSLISSSYRAQKKNYRAQVKQMLRRIEEERIRIEEETCPQQEPENALSRRLFNKTWVGMRTFFSSSKVSDRDKIRGGFLILNTIPIAADGWKKARQSWRRGEKKKAVQLSAYTTALSISSVLTTAINYMVR
jgi:hypothetical protein